MITITSPPIVTASFLEQSAYDSEYFRKYKPNGTRYQLDDDLGHNNYHLGYDYGRRGRADTLYAVCDGIVERVDIDYSGAFGLQMMVRSTASGYHSAAFYAHCESRTTDGKHVRAGDPIGRMGTTGGVPEHLHFSWLDNWQKHDSWRNPGPALRALEAKLLSGDTEDDVALSAEDKEYILQVVTNAVRSAVALIMSGDQYLSTYISPGTEPWKTYAQSNLEVIKNLVKP